MLRYKIEMEVKLEKGTNSLPLIKILYVEYSDQILKINLLKVVGTKHIKYSNY